MMPALDTTGRWSKNQVAAFMVDFANDHTFAPALNMFLLYAKSAYGWPQFPTPVGFSSPTVDTVIAQGLYDERTGMNFAQTYQLHFPRSSLVTSISGGHCVGLDHGPEASALMTQFLVTGEKPKDSSVAGRFIKINWAEGASKLKAVLLNSTNSAPVSHD